MRFVLRAASLAAAFSCLFFVACDRLVEAEAEGVQKSGREVQSEFLARFENAYSEKDVDAAMRLVEMAGAADARRTEKKFRAVFERAFDQRIRRLWFRPPDGNAPLEYMHAGTRYRPNLPIVATLVIEFDISDPAAATSATLPVGRNADGLRFVTSVPAI